MYFLAAPQDAGLIRTFRLCPDTRRPGRAFVLQPRITCAPCREATPCAPAASSPCPTAGRSASRTPASPLSSVSTIRQSHLPLQSLSCVSSRLGIQSVVDARVRRRIRALFCLPSAESVVPVRPGRSSIFSHQPKRPSLPFVDFPDVVLLFLESASHICPHMRATIILSWVTFKSSV